MKTVIFSTRVPAALKAKIKAAAAARGMTVQGFTQRAMAEAVEKGRGK
jgi:predicted DNA binding CopG/RHH family protein